MENSNTLYINKGKYLDSVISEIESGIILAKKFPGIGATTLEIDTPRDSILVVPNVPVIQTKCKKHGNLLGIYEEVTVDKIARYIKTNEGNHKLMTTPESFPKIKKACNLLGIDMYKRFFCLMDECHQLIKDVDYRGCIVLPMADFFQFDHKALVSATPLEFTDPRFTLQNFRTINVDSIDDYKLEIEAMHTNNILQSVKEYLSEKRTSVCIFINSVDIINALMKELNILDKSAVFCAPKSQLKLRNELHFKNTYNEWTADRMKEYSFFTGRFFNAFDLELDYQPNVLMITDVNLAKYTMLDINTDCIQIAGRFRNGLASLTHIYNTSKNIAVKDRVQIEFELSAHEHAYNTIRTFYESASNEYERRAFGEAMESLPFSKLLYQNGGKNYFAIDNRIHDALTESGYNNSDSIEELYFSSYMFNACCTGNYYPTGNWDRLKITRSTQTVRAKRKQMIEILKHFNTPYSEYELDAITRMRDIDPLLIEAYETIGIQRIEELKFCQKKIQEAVILNKRMNNKTVQLIKNSFRIDCKYSCKKIEEELTRIYDLLHIHPDKVIRADMIKNYFQVKPCKVKKDRGYILISELI
ncbi:DEAD/DEAH box helicase family protein [Bacteroides sp.]